MGLPTTEHCRERALVIGAFEDHERQALSFAAGRAFTALSFYENFSDATISLERLDSNISCLFTTNDECGRAATWMRQHAKFFPIPIVSIVSHPSDATYGQANRDGADDAIPRNDLGGITRRLANLSGRHVNFRPPATHGLGLVAFPDIDRRRVFGRTLRTAGFDVAYAASLDELERVLQTGARPSLVLTHPDFPPSGGPAAVVWVREWLNEPLLPVLYMPAHKSEEAACCDTVDSEPSNKLLFFAEETLRVHGKDLRASPRLQHNGLCAFRRAGAREATYGLTHNVSRQGLYVRTLDPPKSGSTLWLEMRIPDHTVPLVHLRGRVIWCREPASMGAIAPAGFGMHIEDSRCPAEDVSLYYSAYDNLHHDSLRRVGSSIYASAPSRE